jgi:hypothetical protein
MSPPPMIREATCSCGKLRATVTGEPISVGVCHCLDCQRRTGGPFAQQARWTGEHVTIEGHSTQYTRHKDDGGAPCTFSFCPECGATVFFQNADRPEVYAIPVGAFADPGFPPPQRSTWEERRHAWVRMPDEIEHLF